MATEATLDIGARGVMEIASNSVRLDAEGVSALRCIAVEREVGGTVVLRVSTDRSMVPYGARLTIDAASVTITLEQAVALLESTWGQALYTDELGHVHWEHVDGYGEEPSGEEGAAEAGEAEAPMASPPSCGLQTATPSSAVRTAPRSLRSILSSSKLDGSVKKAQAAAFKKAEEVSSELHEKLLALGLDGFELAFGKARIQSIKVLANYSVSELEASFQRPVVLGAKFKFDPVQRRMMAQLGAIADGASHAVELQAEAELSCDDVEVAFDFSAAGLHPGRIGGHLGEEWRAPPSSQTKTLTAFGAALVGCEFASILLGSADLAAKEEVGPGSAFEFTSGILEVLAMAAGSAVASSGSSRHSGDGSLENVIDSLDLVLDQIVSKGLVDRLQLKPRDAGARAAVRHARSIAMLIEDKRSSAAKQPAIPLSSDGGLDKLAKVIAASNMRPLSEKDEKVSEELAASQTRLQRVCENPRAAQALACLAELIESRATPLAQLEQFATVSSNFTEVSDIIEASHVRMPTGAGEFSALYPGSELIVKHARLVKTGLKAALKAVTRTMVPAGADTTGAIAEAFAGTLFSATDGSLAHLGSSVKAKLYLGIVAKPLTDKHSNSRAELLVLGIKAIPLLAFMLEKAHPADSTIGLTMTDVLALFGRGVAVRTVAETVDGLLVPLFRAYEEAFVRFQKSATQYAPIMAEVWEREQSAPTVMAFVSLVGTSEASRGSLSGDSGEAQAGLMQRITELEKKLKKSPPQAPRAGAVSPDDKQKGPPLQQADPNSKRSKEKAARLLKEAADGANAGAQASGAVAP